MMREIPKIKTVRYVIAWKSNRMGRNMLEALVNEAKLQDMGVRVLMWRKTLMTPQPAASQLGQ